MVKEKVVKMPKDSDVANSAGEDVEDGDGSVIIGGNGRRYSHAQEGMTASYRIKHGLTVPAVLLGVCPEMKMYVHTKAIRESS
jgi:hypothetical protein